jgi:hypothetical protein
MRSALSSMPQRRDHQHRARGAQPSSTQRGTNLSRSTSDSISTYASILVATNGSSRLHLLDRFRDNNLHASGTHPGDAKSEADFT